MVSSLNIERARDAVTGLWIPAEAQAIDFDNELIRLQLEADPEASVLFRLTTSFAMYWDTGFARDAARVSRAWPQSVDWTYRKLAIRYFLTVSIAWELHEWHEARVHDRPTEATAEATRVPARNPGPRLHGRGCHAFGQKCSSRTPPTPL